MTRYNQYRAVLLCGATLLFAGCNKQDDSKANFQSAINDYYKAHPACIWQDTKKFPVQAATSDDAKTKAMTPSPMPACLLAPPERRRYSLSLPSR